MLSFPNLLIVKFLISCLKSWTLFQKLFGIGSVIERYFFLFKQFIIYDNILLCIISKILAHQVFWHTIRHCQRAWLVIIVAIKIHVSEFIQNFLRNWKRLFLHVGALSDCKAGGVISLRNLWGPKHFLVIMIWNFLFMEDWIWKNSLLFYLLSSLL